MSSWMESDKQQMLT